MIQFKVMADLCNGDTPLEAVIFLPCVPDQIEVWIRDSSTLSTLQVADKGVVACPFEVTAKGKGITELWVYPDTYDPDDPDELKSAMMSLYELGQDQLRERQA